MVWSTVKESEIGDDTHHSNRTCESSSLLFVASDSLVWLWATWGHCSRAAKSSTPYWVAMVMELFSDSLLPILSVISRIGWYRLVLLLAQPP